MKVITLFENVTGAKLKDCISGKSTVFVVQEGEIGKAIGKKGANIVKIERMLKKKIKLIEFKEDICKFVSGLIYPAIAKEIKEEEGFLNIYSDDTKTKSIIIGRDRNRLEFVNNLVKRYFNIKEVKVV